MPNENTYRDCKCNPDEVPQNADYVHNSSTPAHCCDNDKCECHHPLRLWAIKYEVVGTPKFTGVAVVQAKDLCNAQYVFIQNSKFNGFREYIHILCIEELYPNPEPVLLLEDSAAIINHRDLKSYPFLLKSDYEQNIQNISDNVIEAVEDYIEHNPIQQVQSNWNETDETSKAYILNKPTIPVVDLTRTQADNLYQPKGDYALIKDLFSGSYNDLTDKPTLFSGSYNDLSDKPTIPEEQVNADWESESGKSQILNKPTDLVRTSDIEGLLRNDGSVYTGKYLEQVEDLDSFQASEGKIVQYIGETNAKYTNGFNYKKVGTQTVIPAGTEYIDILESDDILTSVGIPNGRYYSVTDETDTVKTKIRIHLAMNTYNAFTRANYAVPVTGKGVFLDVRVGILGYASEFSRVISKKPSQKSLYDWQITFANGKSMYVPVAYYGSDNLYNSSNVYIFENSDGVRIYTIHSHGNIALLVTDYIEEEDVYQVSVPTGIFEYELKTTSSEQTIGVEEWQQCIPPEEDTSHYVLDSDIGWIEH